MSDADLIREPDARDHYGFIRANFRRFVHWAAYNFILCSKRTRQATINGLSLRVPPTVFHPGIFVTSKIFSRHLQRQDLTGKSVVEVGCGSGILALSAARAGAAKVLALDINPAAAKATEDNARLNGLNHVVTARVSDLFSAVASPERFDLIISSPPSFGGEALDLADRAWYAGSSYQSLRPMFAKAAEHLADDGEMLILLSSDTNIPLMQHLARQAGFAWGLVEKKSILVEAFLIFRLTKMSAQT